MGNKYDPDRAEPPFYYTVGEDGKIILTNGEKTLVPQDSTLVSAEKLESCADEKTRKEREELLLERKTANFEIELEEAGKVLTPYRKLAFLRKLFRNAEMDSEQYKFQKRICFLMELSEFFEEIDLEEDEETAKERKLNYLQELHRDNLITTEEYDELRAEILDGYDVALED